MKCSDIESYQNDQLFYFYAFSNTSVHWILSRGKRKNKISEFTNISCIWMYHWFLLTNRVSASDKCDFLTINEKYCYKIISINVLIRSLINQIRKYIRNRESRNFFRLFVSWKYFKLSLKKKTRQSIQKNIISMMPSESYFICRNASIAMFDYRTTEK